MIFDRLRLIPILILAVSIFPMAAKADPILWSTSFVDFNTFSGGVSDVPLVICSQTDAACIGSVTVPGTNMTMSGAAYGLSSYGKLQAYGAASISGSGGTPGCDYAVVRGRAVYQDITTVWSPSESSGSNGSMSLSFTVTGSADASADNFAGFSLNLRLSSSGGGYTDNLFVDNSQTGGVFTTPDILFIFGQPFEYAIWFTAGINIGDFSNRSYAVSDFYHTATLTQIGVENEDNQVVSDFTIQAESGTTYGANGVVPEPTSFILLGTGLAGIGLAACRRKKA